MKLTWAVIALASANDDGDKKFVNKDNFMEAPTPAWWTNHPADKRANTYFKKTPKKFLEAWNLKSDAAAWESKFQFLKNMKGQLDMLINDKLCGRDAQAASTESEDRKRRSVVNMLNSQDLSVDPVDLDDAEDAGLAPRKIKGNDLETDINKMYMNMARYVVEEVLRTPVGRRCNKLGYRMLYRIERLRVASMYMYCRKADHGVEGYEADDLCNYNPETNRPRWRVTKKGELASHPNNDHYKFFDWSDEKEGQDFPQEE